MGCFVCVYIVQALIAPCAFCGLLGFGCGVLMVDFGVHMVMIAGRLCVLRLGLGLLVWFGI